MITSFSWDDQQNLYVSWIGDGHRQIVWNLASAVHAVMTGCLPTSEFITDTDQILYPAWLSVPDGNDADDPVIRALLGRWSHDEELDAQGRELCDETTARAKALRAAILRRVVSADDGQQAQFHCPTFHEQALSSHPYPTVSIKPAPAMPEEFSLATDLQGTCVAVSPEDVDDFLAALNDIRLMLAHRIGADQPGGPTLDSLIARREQEAERGDDDCASAQEEDRATEITHLCQDAYLFTSWWQESLLEVLFSA